MAYPNFQAWKAVGVIALKVLEDLGYSHDDQFFLFWSANEAVPLDTPAFVSLVSVRSVAQRLFGFVAPLAVWESKYQAIVHRWKYPMLVFWFGDKAGQQIPKELAAEDVSLRIHGLWDSAVRDPVVVPQMVDVSALPREFGATEAGVWKTWRSFWISPKLHQAHSCTARGVACLFILQSSTWLRVLRRKLGWCEKQGSYVTAQRVLR